MTCYELQHFLDAQRPVWDQVVRELQEGEKRGHWSWFIFPQLDGLGTSANSKRYAITAREHARAYLAHPVLGARLRDAVRLTLAHTQLPAEQRTVELLG